MAYSKKVVEKFENTLNNPEAFKVGRFDPKETNVGTGMVGAPACGDVMKLQIKCEAKGNTHVIKDVKFKTYGCGSAIASSSELVEMLIGKTLEEAKAIKNIEKCIKNCGLGVDGFVLEQLASSHSILSDDEKDLGVCLVDIGGGTTDIAIFNSGSIVFTGVIPIAGDQVTSDIAQALRTPTPQAEEIKQKHGCAVTEFTKDDETVEVLGVGGRPPRELSRSSLADIIQPRYSELFDLIKAEITRNGFEDKISAGIVFTGGTSKMEGVVELAESIFQTSVRLGIPSKFKGMETILQNPIYSTSIGLIEHGNKQINNEMLAEQNLNLFSKLLRIVKSEY